MFEKELNSITAADIQELVTNQVQEDRRLDYKELCVVQSESEKKGFLADVSAFANTSGGHILLAPDIPWTEFSRRLGAPVKHTTPVKVRRSSAPMILS